MAKGTVKRKAKRDAEWFREQIVTARERLVLQYERDMKQSLEAQEEPSQDLVDRANVAYSREFLFSLSGTQRDTLLQIEDALRRIEAGTYFECAHCGEPIGEARLEAVPWASYCVNCQELREQGLLEDE